MDAEKKDLIIVDPIPQEGEPFSTSADTDKFLKELDDYIEKNIHESVKQRARISNGEFYSNRVLTISSGSYISSPRDPKATIFPIPIPASDESVLGYLDDEGDSILPQSKKFDAPAKKKMIGEMLKCALEGYTNTLRGYDKAHVGPIMTDLANALLRLGGVAQMVARTKRENEKCVHVSRCAGDFINAKCSEIEVKKQHAIDTLTDELGKTKELYGSSLAKVNKLYEELDATNKAKELADQEIEELRGRVKALAEETEQIHLLKANNLSLSK